VLDEVTRPYRDTRIYFCRLEVAALDGDRCALAGAVLDEDTLRGVIAGLSERLPGVDYDVSRVRILRVGAPRAVVATNLTGLYAASSFLAEQVSQLLNGWPVEVLLEDGRWRFVRLGDGYLGWAYGPYLAETAAPAPTHIVCEPVSLLRLAVSVEALPINRVLGGTAVVAEVQGAWAIPPRRCGQVWPAGCQRRNCGRCPSCPRTRRDAGRRSSPMRSGSPARPICGAAARRLGLTARGMPNCCTGWLG
jgi:hypothetical protein